jgi:hypothetical protein
MIGAAVTLLLFGATLDGSEASPANAVCEGQDIAVDGAFEGAAFAACTVGADGTVTLEIRPETEPINPSPWYSARLTQSFPAVRRVELSYQAAGHRYQPWFSIDQQHWIRLTVETVGDAPDRVSVALPAFSGSAFLSAQPLMSLAAVTEQWRSRQAEGLVVSLAGATSTAGRAVPLFRAGPADAARVHVMATRQHPPETGGAQAFDAFATRLLALHSAAPCRSDAILFAPILNPDGIVRGHWRTNGALIDLNRDWGRFTQPETRALGAAMADVARSATIVSVIDFHSTRTGAIYVPRTSDRRASAFAAAVAQGTGFVVIETRSAGGETLKSWSEDAFGSASFTVELPDSASPQQAAMAGTAIAEHFALHYLCSDTGVSR